MRDLPEALVLAKNKLNDTHPWVILLEITLTSGVVIRVARNTEDITFEGKLYTRFAFDIEPIVQHNKGEIPQVEVAVSNVSRFLQPFLEDLDGAIESTVRLIVVNTGYLEQDHSELELNFDVLKTETNAQVVTFTLGAPNPLRQRFPLDRYIAKACAWIFDTTTTPSVECAYLTGNPDGEFATCEKTFEACFIRNNAARFGGFPGLKSGGIKVA